MNILRMVFQQSETNERKQMVLVLDMESDAGLTTAQIPGLADKMQAALPGIFPDSSESIVHNCGAGDAQHAFRDEIERGTDIPHLLEHVLLHLLTRRTYCGSGFCGRRSADIDSGITTHYYIVLDCPSELEAVVAVAIGFELVSAWISGRSVTVDGGAVLGNIHRKIEPMVRREVTQPGV